jgi:hypothetical protein
MRYTTTALLALLAGAQLTVAWLAARRGQDTTARLAGATAPVTAAGAAWCGLERHSYVLAAALAVAAALAAAILARATAPPCRPVLAAVAVLAPLGWASEVGVVFDGTRRAAAVPALLASVAIGVLPRTAFGGGSGLPMLDVSVRSGSTVTVDRLRSVLRQASATLQVTLWCCAAVAIGAGAGLAFTPGWSFALLAVLAALTWTRTATLFTAAVHAAPLVTLAAALTVETAAALGHWIPTVWIVVATAALSASALAGAAAASDLPPVPAWTQARARVSATWAEWALTAAAVVCAAGALGVFAALAALTD